jgi:hypothetical protein
MSTSTSCFPTGFSALFASGSYKITASAINIQNITTGAKFIGVYSQNQFTVPIGGGPSTPVTLQVINPANNKVVDTLTDIITFSLGEITECITTNFQTGQTTIANNAQLAGYSQYFGSINTKVNVNSSYIFTKFENNISTAFQASLNGEAGQNYSINANGVFIQLA